MLTCVVHFAAVLKDKLESRLISWTDYFQQCVTYLDGESDKMPTLPAHKTSSPRVECPKILGMSPRHVLVRAD